MNKFKLSVCAAIVGGLTVWAGLPAIGEDAAKPAAGGMDAKMAEMMNAEKPGPQHAQLAKYVGEFTADVQMWMDPKQPAQKATGKERNEMFGGRHLLGAYEGDMMGQPFQGRSCMGYDNNKKKWSSAWIDDMSTGVMFAEGDADASGKTVTFKSDMLCHMTGKVQPFRQVATFVDDDTYKYEMHTAGLDGKEFKTMEITYKRVK
jgi:hypothetical protein